MEVEGAYKASKIIWREELFTHLLQFSSKLEVSIRHFLDIYFAPWTSEKLLFFLQKNNS